MTTKTIKKMERGEELIFRGKLLVVAGEIIEVCDKHTVESMNLGFVSGSFMRISSDGNYEELLEIFNNLDEIKKELNTFPPEAEEVKKRILSGLDELNSMLM